MIRFISNTQNDYNGYFHKDQLGLLLDQAEEVIFSVGFMKHSGWKLIEDCMKRLLADKGRRAFFFIGTGEGVTDPKVLKELFRLCKGKVNSELILCNPAAGIFHSKVYLFRIGEKVTIVTGSANLTQGGWLLNDECSMLVETNVYSEEYRQVLQYFDGLKAKYRRPDLEVFIRRYEQAVDDYRKKTRDKTLFSFTPDPLPESQVNLAMLQRYFELYPSSQDYVVPQEREGTYALAKGNLIQLAASNPMTDTQFRSLFGPLMRHRGYEKLWHSGSIHRATHMTYGYQDGFRELVRYAMSKTNLPAGEAFSQVMHFLKILKAENRIKGIGENIVTEILMTLNPLKFANLNENPLKGLKMAGCVFPSPEKFTAGNYTDFLTVLTHIRNELGMASFLEIDSFFNYIYWD